MTASIVQRLGGNYQSGQRSADYRATWPYLIWDATDDADAMAALRASAPATYSGLPATNYNIEPTNRSDLWFGSVTYGVPAKSKPVVIQPDTFVIGFDTSGQQIHVQQSLATVSTHGGTRDFGRSIGVSEQGVAGADIIVPTYTEEVTRGWDPEYVDSTYRRSLMALVGKVNSDAFKDWEAGEVLFLGARGTRRGTSSQDDWEITYRFSISPNRTDFPIRTWNGTAFADADITKRGWDYLWMYSEARKIDGRFQFVPIQANVEQVYPMVSFSLLSEIYEVT